MEGGEGYQPETKESDIKSNLEIIMTPRGTGDVELSRSRKEGKLDTVEQKVLFLQSVLEKAKELETNGNDALLDDQSKKFIESATEILTNYKDKLLTYSGSDSVENLIEAKVPVTKIDSVKWDNIFDAGNIEKVAEVFESNDGDKVCLSKDHGSTFINLSAAYNSRTDRSARVAAIVFDNHVDLYRNPFDDTFIDKKNLFNKLADNDVIEGATFIGCMDHNKLIERRNKEMEEKGKNVRYEQIKIDDLNKDGQTDRVFLVNQLDGVVKNYKERGMTNVVFSVDIDVLRNEEMIYTAMEYNPIEILNKASLVTLPLDKDVSDLNQSDFEQINRQLGSRFINPDSFRSKGLALGDVGISLDTIADCCKKYDLKFGIEMTGGGNYLGDIVELDGRDYKGKTARATVALLERIKNLSKRAA